MKGLPYLLSVKWPLARPMITIVVKNVPLWATGIYNKNQQKKEQCEVSPEVSSDRICPVLHPTKATKCRQLHTIQVYQYKVLNDVNISFLSQWNYIIVHPFLHGNFKAFYISLGFFIPSTINSNSFLFFFTLHMYSCSFKKKIIHIPGRYPMILFNWRATVRI